MKSSTTLAIAAIFSVATATISTVHAAEDIVKRVAKGNTPGTTSVGTVLDVTNNAVRLKMKSAAGEITTSIPLEQIDSVTMQAPREYDAVIAKWREGDVKGTLALLEPLVAKFRGLPSPWMERAMILLGEVKLTGGDIEGAEKVFADFQVLYPESTQMAEVALGRLALEKGNIEQAREKVSEVASEARATLSAGPEKSAQFAQALFVMGGAYEKDEAFQDALANYMLIITVFNSDAALVKQAEVRAATLKEKKIVVP